MTKPTRDEVAALAGVSAATVSYVLNNGPRQVSAERRERVLAACRSLGYRPNAIARGLRSRHTRILGLVIPDSANPYFAGLARCLEDVAFASGYHVLVGNSADDPARELSHLSVLLEMRVEGILYVAADVNNADVAGWWDPAVPVVMVDRELDNVPADAVVPDNRQGGRLAAEHLIGLGHRRLACISGPEAHAHAQARIAGVLSAVAGAGLPAPAIAGGRFDYASGHESALALLRCPPEQRATGLICANDAMAIGALLAAAELGLPVPEALSLVGFDDIPQAAYAVPPLTTLSQPLQAMAELAVHTLIGRLHGADQPPVRRRVPLELVVRASTARPTS